MPDQSFNVQSKLTRTLVLTPYKQTAWGTAIGDANLLRSQRFDGSAVPDFGDDRRSDKEMSGKGNSFATNSQRIMRSVKLSGLKSEATDWIVAFVLANLMGKVTTTGGAAPYTHTITFDESTRTSIPTTVYLQETADLAYRLLDMFSISATLTIPAKGAISLDWDMLGTGIKTKGLLGVAPTVPAENYLMGNDTVCSFGPVGSPATFTGRHMSSTIKFENQGMVHEAPGGGLFGIFGRRGDPKFSIETVIAAKEVDDIFTHYDADDQMAMTLTTNSGANCQLIITVPKVNLKATKLGFDGDMPIWNISLDETVCYQNGATPPISVQVVSSQASWLGAPPA